MEIILAMLAVLAIVGVPTLAVLFLIKRNKTSAGQMFGPFAGRTRRNDGAVSYNEYRGMRFNVELEDPRGSQSPRHQRRHSLKQHKQTKPWMK